MKQVKFDLREALIHSFIHEYNQQSYTISIDLILFLSSGNAEMTQNNITLFQEFKI